MNRSFFVLPLTLFLLAGVQSCSKQEVQVEVSKPTVVQLHQIRQASENAEYEFPATVSAVKNVDIKFEVSGRLISVNLAEGHQVKKGELLAQIDPAPFERKVEENRVRHDVAVKEFNRIKNLFHTGAASQSLLDNAESQFEITKIALANAKQDLSYTQVTAPFDAFISKRLIENNSYIGAGDSIASLQDRSKLYFSFDVPERIITKNAGNKEVEAKAYVIGRPDQVFDLHYVEHQTTPDPITQTYAVTFAIDNKDGLILTPGARAIIKVSALDNKQHGLILPITALAGDKEGGFNVWLFDSSANAVTKKLVNVLKLEADYALIQAEYKGVRLNAGDKVVSAAVSQMSEGLLVKEYKAEY